MTRRLLLEVTRTVAPEQPFGFGLDQPYTLAWGNGRRGTLDLRGLAAPGAPGAQGRARLGSLLAAALEPWLRDHQEDLRALSRGEAAELCISSAAAELGRLPWEQVPGPDGVPIGLHPGFLLRFFQPGSTARPLSGADPEAGRVLLLWSASGGRVPAAGHTGLIRRFVPDFDPSRDVLADPGVPTLRAALPGAAPVRILHLLCHGIQPSEQDHGLLIGGQVWTGQELAAALAAQPPKLVLLLACHSAEAGNQEDYLGSVALALHRVGVDAVVGSRGPLRIDHANALVTALYPALFEQHRSVEELLAALRTELPQLPLAVYGAPPPPGGTRPWVFRPYCGLLPFERKDAAFFSGRDQELARLGARLESLAQQTRKLMVLTGSSGAGKSSLVRAGLAQRLPADAWLDWSPGLAPWQELGQLLFGQPDHFRKVAAEADALAGLEARLAQSPAKLLVVDPLDALLFGVDRREDREALLQILWAISLHLSVLLVMRLDRLPELGVLRLDAETRLEQVVFDDTKRMFLGEPGAEAIRRAVLAPAQRVGIQVQPELVDALIRDLQGVQPALPLLQLCLDQLWLHREGPTLGLVDYQRRGRVDGILTRVAEQLLAELPLDEEVEARRCFSRLVRVDSAGANGRLLVPLFELRPAQPDRAEAFDRMVERTCLGRILVLREGCLTLAHDALLVHCEILKRWLEEEHQRITRLQWAREEAAEWEGHHRAEGFEPRGRKLRELEDIAEHYPEELSEGVLAFLEAGRALRDRELREQQTRIQELSVALQARDQALGARDAAISVVAAASVPQDPSLAALLLCEASGPPTEGWIREAMRTVCLPLASLRLAGLPAGALPSSLHPLKARWLERRGGLLFLCDVQGERRLEAPAGRWAVAACLSPDGETVAIAWSKGSLELRPVAGGVSKEIPVEIELRALLWPPGTPLIVGGAGGEVAVLEESGLQRLWLGLGAVSRLRMSGDGKLLVGIHEHGGARVGSLQRVGGTLRCSRSEAVSVPLGCRDVVVGPDGATLAVMDLEGQLWLRRPGEAVRRLERSPRATALAWPAEGLTIGDDSGRIQRLEQGGRRWPVSRQAIRELEPSPQPGELWLSTEGGQLLRMRMQPAGRSHQERPGVEISAISCSSDGQFRAVLYRDGELHIGQQGVQAMRGSVALCFHPREAQLLATADPQGLKLWSVGPKGPELIYRDVVPGLAALSWSRADSLLVGVTLRGGLRCWSPATPRGPAMIWSEELCSLGINELRWPRDGRRLLVCPTAEPMCVVDMPTGKVLHSFPSDVQTAAWIQGRLLLGLGNGELGWESGEHHAVLPDAVRDLLPGANGAIAIGQEGGIFALDREGEQRWRARIPVGCQVIRQSINRSWLYAGAPGQHLLYRVGHADARPLLLPVDGDPATALFSPTGTHLSVGTRNGNLDTFVVGTTELRSCLGQVGGKLSEEERALFWGR